MSEVDFKNKNQEHFVTFRLGNEIYGINIFQIQEVMHLQKITPLPDTPEIIEGVVSVRDEIVPVINLRKLLKIGEPAHGKMRIVILEIEGSHLGIIIDDIYKVIRLDSSNCEELPATIMSNASKVVSRLAKYNNELIIIISPENMLDRNQRDIIDNLCKK